PDVLDARGVLADQQGLEMLDGANYRQLATAQARLANPVDARIRVDRDEQVVARAVVHRERLDVRDLHARRAGYPCWRWRKASYSTRDPATDAFNDSMLSACIGMLSTRSHASRTRR